MTPSERELKRMGRKPIRCWFGHAWERDTVVVRGFMWKRCTRCERREKEPFQANWLDHIGADA